MEYLHETAHPPKISQMSIVRHVERIPELQQRQHPLFFFIILDHGMHGLILIH